MEGIRGIQHPLETPIILEIVFKNLEIDDLKSCRLVCRTWRHETAKAMRSTVKVRIGFSFSSPRRKEMSFLELLQSESSTFSEAPFADTFEIWQSQNSTFSGKPFTDAFRTCPRYEGSKEGSDILEICGDHVKSLWLQVITFHSPDAFRHVIYQSCPNLQELKLESVQVHGERVPKPEKWIPLQYSQNENLKVLTLDGTGYDFNVSWLEILSHFPSLEKLRVSGNPDDCEGFFGALEIARNHDADCWQLKEVHLCCHPEPFNIIPLPCSFKRVFDEGNFALTRLEIELIDGRKEEEVSAIQKILAHNADSLKILCLINEPYGYSDLNVFPLPGNRVLKHVQSLQILAMALSPRAIQQAFPNVKKLSIDKAFLCDIHNGSPQTFDHCTQLEIYIESCDPDDLRKLIELLPSVKILGVYGLNNESFPIVCQNWPNLTHLRFRTSNLDDSGITGYDLEDAQEINEKGKKGSWKPINGRRANRFSLNNLEVFSLTLKEGYPSLGYCSEQGSNIISVTIPGSEAPEILELPQLKHLQVACLHKEDEVPFFSSLRARFPYGRKQDKIFDFE